MWEKNCQVCQFIVNIDTFSPITTDETFKIDKGTLNCNSKKVVYLSECKKCKNLHVDKAQTKMCMRLNNYKSAHKSLKLRNQKHRNHFMDAIYRMIMKVRTIGNLR